MIKGVSGFMGEKSYKDALIDKDIPYSVLVQGWNKPRYVYKYQNFYDADGSKNVYWKDSFKGLFHLSLPYTFEDKNDCAPFYNSDDVKKIFYDFLDRFSPEKKDELIQELMGEIDDEHFDRIKENYQKSIYIGCFAKSPSIDEMWNKYSNDHTGYCIEYEVEKDKLLSEHMLPVLYSDSPYNSSFAFALSVLLESIKAGKGRTDEENIKYYGKYYERLQKMSYVPVFIKQRSKWAFEEECRLFLTPHVRMDLDKTDVVEAKSLMDDNDCIDLSQAVSRIYIGKHFDKNPDSEALLEEIKSIAGDKLSFCKTY